jgi:uncharacterized protein DUF3307
MHPMLTTCLALLLAHVLGDFVFQSNRMVLGKKKGIRSYVEHGAIHFLILSACIAFFSGLPLASWKPWILFACYMLVHLFFDFGKQQLVKRATGGDSTSLFVLDQSAHLFSIVVISGLVSETPWRAMQSSIPWTRMRDERVLATLVVYTTAVFAAGYLIRYLTRSVAIQVQPPGGETNEQLRNAGLYIGWLERFLVLTAVAVQSPAMVGLILTGKSIARFTELKEAKFAEYFLIGTFLSITLALIGGLILLKVWYGTISLK